MFVLAFVNAVEFESSLGHMEKEKENISSFLHIRE